MDKLWLLYVFITIVTWGAWGFLAKLAEKSLTPWSVYVFASLPVAAIGLLGFAITRLRPTWHPEGSLLAILAGLSGAIGVIVFYFALGLKQTALVVPLTALYPLVTVILGRLFLKEQLSVTQWAGVAFALIAAALLSR